MGRAYRIRKRSNHVTIIVAADKMAKPSARIAKKADAKGKADSKVKSAKNEATEETK
jgi:hypothetical protein